MPRAFLPRAVADRERHLIRRLANRFLLPLWNQCYVDVGGGPADAVFLAGTERSGTTWVAESVNYASDYRFMFEPFWPQQVPASSPITPQEYIRPGDRSPAREQAASTILSGNIRNRWVDRYHRNVIARKRLIKDVRSNLYLKWLNQLFPKMPIILLMRHPCAVAKSQIERKHGFASTEKTFLSQPDLIDDFLQPFVADIRHEHSPFEDRIFRWCIQNYVPLKQFGRGEIHVVFYENLCVNAEAEFSRLLDYLHRPFEADLLTAAARPSPMSQQDSAVNTAADMIDSWRDAVSPANVSAAGDIMKLFGLDGLYGAASMPSAEALSQFMES